jgi:hypothetical protein
VLSRIGVSSADVFVLQSLELLLCAEFVGLERVISICIGICDALWPRVVTIL